LNIVEKLLFPLIKVVRQHSVSEVDKFINSGVRFPHIVAY